MNGKRPVFFIFKNRALGDSVMGLSTLQYLRNLYPDSKIIYGVPAWIAPLYKNVKTAADEIYPLVLNSLSDWLNLYAFLLNEKVDAIHEMHQSGRGQKVFSLFHFFSRIQYTFHNHHLLSGTNIIDQGEKKELIQRDLDGVYSFYALGQSIPLFLDYMPRMQLCGAQIPKLKKRIILGVVATRQTKMWPLKNYVELSKLLVDSFSDLEIVIPLSKSPADKAIQDELENLELPKAVKIVHWPLEKLPHEFSGSLFYIGNDTGIKHLAISVGVKTFTFFGPEPIREWHPYNELDHPFFYLEPLACRVRSSHYCGLSVCDLGEKEFMQCLTHFSAEKVFEVIKAYI